MNKLIIFICMGLCFNSCNFGEINIVGHKKKKPDNTIIYTAIAPINTQIIYIDSNGENIFDQITDSLEFSKTVIFNKNIIYILTLMVKTNPTFPAKNIKISIRNNARKTKNEVNMRCANDLTISLSEDFNTFR